MASILDYLEKVSEIDSTKKSQIYEALKNPTKASINHLKEKNDNYLKGNL